MTTDYRALCAELADDLEPWITYGEIEAIEKSHDLIDRARAALAAEPAPFSPDGEVARAVAWLRQEDGGIARRATYSRIADLLERLAPQPVPEGPSDEELVNFRNRATADCCASRSNNGADLLSGDDLVECQAAGLRAVLARWGTSNLAQVRSSLGDRPQPVPEREGPADDDIEALHQAVFASRLHGPPPNTSFEVDLVRAALARWGHAPNA